MAADVCKAMEIALTVIRRLDDVVQNREVAAVYATLFFWKRRK